MPHFSTAEEAFEWAMKVIEARRNGRSNMALFEMVGMGGIPKDYAILDAVEIHHCAKRACQGERTCPMYSAACLIDWWMPDQTVEQVRKSDHQVQRIKNCIEAFEDELWEKDFLIEAPRRRR